VIEEQYTSQLKVKHADGLLSSANIIKAEILNRKTWSPSGQRRNVSKIQANQYMSMS
jgi:hypothetical protein